MLHDPQNRPNERLNLRATPNGRLIGYGLSGDVVFVSLESLRGAYDGWYKVNFRDSGELALCMALWCVVGTNQAHQCSSLFIPRR